MIDHDKIARDAVKASPQLQRGQVWCHSCGATQRVDSAQCLHYGWPLCCDETMSIDSPAEREALRKARER